MDGWIGWDGMVLLYTVTPRASLKSDANKRAPILCHLPVQILFFLHPTHPSLQGEFQFGGTTVAAHHTVLFQQSGGTVEMINVGEV